MAWTDLQYHADDGRAPPSFLHRSGHDGHARQRDDSKAQPSCGQNPTHSRIITHVGRKITPCAHVLDSRLAPCRQQSHRLRARLWERVDDAAPACDDVVARVAWGHRRAVNGLRLEGAAGPLFH